MEQSHRPLARHEQLAVRVLDNETLVYKLDSDECVCLEGDAAKIWSRCDGTRSIDDLPSSIDNADRDQARQIVSIALEQLRAQGLIVAGSITFGVTWVVFNLFPGLIASSAGCGECGFLMIPVVGPVVLGIASNNITAQSGLIGLLAIDTIVQAGGMAMLIAGLAISEALQAFIRDHGRGVGRQATQDVTSEVRVLRRIAAAPPRLRCKRRPLRDLWQKTPSGAPQRSDLVAGGTAGKLGGGPYYLQQYLREQSRTHVMRDWSSVDLLCAL